MFALKRFFTGITTTGTLTLGHYLGVIKQILKIQNDHEVIIMIADLHALNTLQPNFNYREKAYEIASLLYACGLKEGSKIFIQSDIKEHAELTLLLSPHITVGKLGDMIQFKEKKKEQETGNLALFSYPVLMAADIFLYDADLVIVGQDQKQHTELAVDLATKFNDFCKQGILKIPKFEIPEFGGKIMGLKNPEKKMSKSENDFISLLDTPEIVEEKITNAKTDSENKVYYDPENKKGISNLLTIYALLNNQEISEAEREMENLNYSQFKEKVIRDLNTELALIQIKYKEYRAKIQTLLKSKLASLRWVANRKMDIIYRQLKLL